MQLDIETNRIYHDDWTKNNLPNKSVQLIIADPPYFEIKGDFDFVWESFDDYLKDVEKWAIECKRLLAENGTLFWYGHAKRVAYTQIILDKYFTLENNITIEFNRQTKKGVESFRCFAPVSERLLMYSNMKDYSPFAKLINERAQELKLKEMDFRKLRPSKNGNPTGWMSNILLGKNLPNKEDWIKIETLIQSGEDFDSLSNEYQSKRRYFNNHLKLYDVMTFDQESHITKNYDHDTCKPETLTRALILTCSRLNDLVFVPFAGSGTEAAMAIKEGRKVIGFDIEGKYVKMGNERIQAIKAQPSLFQIH
jgi:site-specific DNA-methyltransferase (adenine-specific)